MYQPPVPLIPMSPALRARRLGEVELGQLVLLRDGAGIGLRADTLSPRGDVAEGVLRLSGTALQFEAVDLAETVIAMEIAYLLEADAASATVRAPHSGDLVVTAGRTPSGLFVPGLWSTADGLCDIASAIIRPYPRHEGVTPTVLGWRLVEREARSRVLFDRGAVPPARAAQELREPQAPDEAPRRRFVEDSD
jgi:hypothetical protein